jgi:hypothetical protein
MYIRFLDVRNVDVRDTETVEEVAYEDPCAMGIDTFLDTHVHDCKVMLELRLRDTVQQRSFFDNLR